MLLPLALTLALAPPPASVELDRETWHRLHPAAPAELAVPAWAADRTVELTPVPGGVLVRATWTVRALSRDTWFSGQVLGDIPGMRVEQVTWDGKPVATRASTPGVTVAGRVTGRATLALVAFVPAEPTREPLALSLLPAVRGRVTAVAPEGLAPTLRVLGPPPPSSPPGNTIAPPEPPAPASSAEPTYLPESPPPVPVESAALHLGAEFRTGAEHLRLTYAAPPSPQDRAVVVVARAGVGLTVGDAELRGRARLVWEVRQGSIDAVDFTAAGTAPDLQIKGTGVREVQRSGDRVHVALQAPVAGRLELDLTWSAPLAKTAESRAPLPQFSFDGVFRSESALQLARDGEVEAVPTATGWTSSAAAALPTWAQGLVEGTPTAAFRGTASASGHLDLLRFVPIEGPPVVIDVAAYTIATSREGRALIRAHYEVRNERAATLRVRPPPGFTVLGVRVAGETATPARDRDGAWRIPLQRSVETVSGVLSFPVEIALLGGSAPWDRRERRALQLPQLDAPVAVARVTLHLPPGYRSRVKPGDGEVVQAFTRGDGITYGLGVGAVGAAEADAVFQSAVKNWLGNDFKAAQADLDRLKAMGARNDNIDRLQGNLYVIDGRNEKEESGASRRIREQAKARSVADQAAQVELKKKADESRKAGDYEAAQSQYKAALEVGDRLAKLEQKETFEQKALNQSLVQELESTAGEYRAKEKQKKSGKRIKPARQFASKSLSDAQAQPGAPAFGSTPVRDGDGIVDQATAEPPPDKPAEPTPTEPTAIPPKGSAASLDVAEIAGEFVTPQGDKSPSDAPMKVPPPAPPAPPAQPAPPAPVPGEPLSRDTGVAIGAEAIARTSGAVVYDFADDTVDVSATSRTTSVTREVRNVSQSLPGVAARARRFGRLRKTGNAAPGPHLDTKFKAEREAPEKPPQDPALAGLPTPVVTASAVSVVVPQVGQAVLYQRLLLPADATHTIDISAREPLIAKD